MGVDLRLALRKVEIEPGSLPDPEVVRASLSFLRDKLFKIPG